MSNSTPRVIWLGVAVFVLGLLGANAHLAYVAFASQPACIAHSPQGAASTEGVYAAAVSSC